MSKTVELHTTAGVIRLELDEVKAPVTVSNFLEHVQKGLFDGTVFHRVIKGFMIQGGGFEPGLKQREPLRTVVNEADNGLKNERYTVAMARTSAPHSAGSQFFINGNSNDFLNHKSKSPEGWGYAVFGKVVDGTAVVDQIENVKTGRKGMHDDVPVEDVVIIKAVEV